MSILSRTTLLLLSFPDSLNRTIRNKVKGGPIKTWFQTKVTKGDPLIISALLHMDPAASPIQTALALDQMKRNQNQEVHPKAHDLPAAVAQAMSDLTSNPGIMNRLAANQPQCLNLLKSFAFLSVVQSQSFQKMGQVGTRPFPPRDDAPDLGGSRNISPDCGGNADCELPRST